MQSSEVKIIDEQRGNGDSFYRHIFFMRGDEKYIDRRDTKSRDLPYDRC